MKTAVSFSPLLRLSFASSVVLGLLAACSFTSMVDVRVAECSGANAEGDRRCQEVLNPEHGYYEGCAAFKCVPFEDYFQCQQVEGEVCDGQDNDCDYLIDEPNEEQNSSLLSISRTPLATGISSAYSASIADSNGFGSMLYTDTADSSLALPFGTEVETPTPIQLKTQPADPQNKTELQELTSGCWVAGNDSPAAGCGTSSTVTTANDEIGFFAYINQQGCSSGELRVGAIDSNQLVDFIDRGLGSRAPSYRGVATEGSRCSNNGSSACAALKAESNPALSDLIQACGVSAPAIAAIEEQAMVAYLGNSASSNACPQSAVDVFGLLLHERKESITWADPSDDGAPQSLGKTLGRSAPAVVAVDDVGFVVAHSDPAGDIRLLWVPRQAAPGPNDGLTCPGDDCDSRDGLHTEAMQGIVELAVLPKSREMSDAIALSLLPLSDNEVALSLTWLEGCALDAAAAQPAYAQILRVSLNGGVAAITAQYERVSLGESLVKPQSLLAESDFVVPGFERDGRKATEGESGGFYVMSKPRTLEFSRLAVFDGQTVDGEVRTTVTSPTEAFLTPFYDEFVSHDTNTATLSRRTLLCE